MKGTKAFGVLLIAILLCFSAAAADKADTEALTITGDNATVPELLAEYPNLRTLTLQDCPAFDLTTLASCTRLTTLTIAWSDDYEGTATYDLTPLAQCSRLSTLTLIGHGIEDLSALAKLTKVTALTVASTAATDFTPITQLDLKHLRLLGANAEAVTAVFTAIGRGLESAEIGDCTLTSEANDSILAGTRLISLSFTNAEGIDGESTRWAKLNNLTCLTMTGGSVSSLSFCDSYVATVGVKLTDVFTGGAVCSVDFDKYFLTASNVPHGEMLKLIQGSGRRWQYITVRQHEEATTTLIAAFADISSLLSLDIQAVAPEAFSAKAWEGFPKLEQLKLSGCTAVSLDILTALPGLLRLSVRNAAISGTEAIGSLRKLQQLTLIDCTTDSWLFATSLGDTSLTLLNLSGCNGPETIGFVKDLEKLKVLALEYSPVTELVPLTGLSIESLYLYGCAITDYRPLQSLPFLKLLSCSADAVLPELSCRVFRRCITSVQ